MNTSTTELHTAQAQRVTISEDALTVDLADGRTLTVPLAWFPRLQHGSPAERNHYRLLGGGTGLHWPDLDEDLSVANLLAGKPAAESPASLQRWLASRKP